MARTSAHYTLADDQAEAVWFIGTLATLKATGDRTGDALAMVEFTHPPGFATPRHVHHTADEAFYVLEGAMRGHCGDEMWRATAGSFVWLPRDVPHDYAVEGDARCGRWRSPCPPDSTASSRRRGTGAGARPAAARAAGHRQA